MSSAYSPLPGRRGAGNRFGDPGVAGLKVLVLLVGLMWTSEFLDTFLGGALDTFGIQARDSDGLIGIAAAPFLHAGFGHLISNTVPLLMLGAIIAASGAAHLLGVTVVVALVSGLGTWLTSPPGSITVGASGIVFGYATYLIVRGIFNRSLGQLLIGLLVVVIWGGALLSGLLPQAGISWQGHFFGAVGGLISAWLLSGSPRRTTSSRSTSWGGSL
jgi:membrane associated rhomboid family serine protease